MITLALILGLSEDLGSSLRAEQARRAAQAELVIVEPAAEILLKEGISSVEGFDQCESSRDKNCLEIESSTRSVPVKVMYQDKSGLVTVFESWRVDRHVGFINLQRPNGDPVGKLFSK